MITAERRARSLVTARRNPGSVSRHLPGMNPRVWLIGENNPYGDDPRFAMYPQPTHSAGGRMCRLVLGMCDRDYLREFERRNLLQAPKWSAPLARAAAAQLVRDDILSGDRVVLLGRRVHDAFFPEWEWTPFSVCEQRYVVLPHPSGLSRAWNEPGAYARARKVVAEVAPHLREMMAGDS